MEKRNEYEMYGHLQHLQHFAFLRLCLDSLGILFRFRIPINPTCMIGFAGQTCQFLQTLPQFPFRLQ